MIRRAQFKASDLLKIKTLSVDEIMTHFLSHIVRCAGDREKLTLLRQALFEIDNFIVETLSENKTEDNVN